MNISEQMRLVFLDAVEFALSKNHQCCKGDGFGYEVDLNDAKDFLEISRGDNFLPCHPVDREVMEKAANDTAPFIDAGSAIHLYLNRGGTDYSLEVMTKMYHALRENRMG